MFNHILLCTHGTPGAQKAERLVFEQLAPGFPEAKITVLTIINEDWKFMGGDDWLNTDKARMQFFHHLGDTLGDEIQEDWARIRRTYPASEKAQFGSTVGAIEETMARAPQELGADLVVIGPYQKKQGRGFKARLANKKLHPLLTVPVMIAPEEI